ncbi:MAG: AraC-like DNA-binding protein [Motiliproteus sp.]|jgi:AraC-like DNA-binding protein
MMRSEIVIPNRSMAFEGLDIVDARYQSTVFGKHIHEEYTIGVIENGAQKFLHKGKIKIAAQNQLVIVNPDDVHTGETASPEGWRYRAMYPTSEHFNDVYRDLDLGCDRAPYFPESVVSAPDIACHIRIIFDQISLNATRLHTEALLYALLIKMILRLSTRRPVRPKQLYSKQKLYRAKEYIRATFDQDISLKEVAETARLSQNYLIRAFTNEFGLPPHGYQLQLKINKAKCLLKKGYLTSEVAIECGFYDQSHLHRHFLRSYGISPGKFRRNMNS